MQNKVKNEHDNTLMLKLKEAEIIEWDQVD
jgi:hypothetical protein